jgi:hypothetical protein
MIQIDEYALATVLLFLGMTAFALQVYDWKGIEDSPTATRILKISAGLLIAGCLLFFMAVIIKKRGHKAWSTLLVTTALPSPTATPLVLLGATPSPLPQVASTASPFPTITPTPRVAPAYFNGAVSLVGSSNQRLDEVLKGAGYKGPMMLETVEFYNHSETDICWRVRAVAERCVSPGDDYNFPGGADATQVYLSAKATAKLDIGLKSR